MALARAALALANGDKSRVTVVGQPLGGGQTSLVTGALGITGYAIAPAPFAKYIAMQALIDTGPQGQV